MGLPAILGSIVTAGLTYIFTGKLILSLIFGGLTLLSSVFTPKARNIKRKPASISDFSISQANENIPIPLIYGKVRIPGNIIWYGNLVTEPVDDSVKGWKGIGKRQKLTRGYNYYVDIWYGLCFGDNVTIEQIIIDNDPEKEVVHSGQYFNEDPPIELEFLPAYHNNHINHVFFKKFFVGFNRTTLPTLHFVLRRSLNTPLPYNNIWIFHQPSASFKFVGCNPIAVLFDLLTNQAHIPVDLIDMNSWNEVCIYYQNQNLGINLAVTSETNIHSLVNDILQFLGAFIYYTPEGKIGIKVIKPGEKPVAIIQDDFIDFHFGKKSWTDVPNTFHATFIDADNNWTERVVIVDNPAGKYLANKTIQESLDFTYIIDRDIAVKKLQEYVKQHSYPRSVIECTVPLKYSFLKVGDIVTIIHSDYLINGDFRIVNMNFSTITEGKIKLSLVQYSEKVLDSYTIPLPTPTIPTPNTTLVPFTKIRILELNLPEIYTNKHYPTFVFLVNREKGIETGFIIYYSTDRVNYEVLAQVTTFSVYATLDETYPANTYQVDDENEIQLTCYKPFDIGLFSSVSRKKLFDFSSANFLIINNEIMTFQTIQPISSTKFKIKNLNRKLFWTTQSNHNLNSPCWLTLFKDNVIEMPTISDTYYFKIAPVFRDRTIPDLSKLTTFRVTTQFLVNKPDIGRVVAVRNGSTVTITVFPIVKTHLQGAGYYPENMITDRHPFPLDGEILYRIGTSGNFTSTTSQTFTITNSSSFTLQVRTKNKNFLSDIVSLYVGSADGEYVYSK
ncbi:MAG: phage tail protein [Zestosphaera sp.]